MALLDVKVKIEVSKATGSVGFGVPLLLECGAEAAIEYKECYSLEEVVTAGYAADSDMYKAATMVFQQENRPTHIAVCTATGTIAETLPTIVDKGWRQVVIVNGDSTQYVDAADYIETTNNKMLFLSMSKTDWATFKGGLTGKKYDRTVIFINATENAAAALVGETAGRKVGSFTYKFKTLKGVAAENFTDAEIRALHQEGAFAYATKYGDDVTTEGISQSRKFIDITDSIDYVVQNIEYRIQKLLNQTAKVPYDNRGIALIESATISALQDAFNNGIIATLDDGVTADYSVSFAARSETTAADREAREYKYGSFTFALAGAIHTCEVTGEVTY